jgi:hypothetical protein
MIDIENEVYDRNADVLRAKYENIFISGDDSKVPSSFPCAYIVQRDNPVVMDHADSGAIERVVSPMFEVNVYSNLKTGRKQQAKEIMATICDVMSGLDIERTYCQPTPNADSSIYRITARFSCKTDGNKIYRR